MSTSAKSVFVFGIYVVVLGIGLLVVPNLIFSLFGVPATKEVWIRVAGMLVLLIGYYYIQTARKGLTEFFQLTVYTRAAVFVFFIAFVLLKLADPKLILFGVVDLLGAIWIQLALRSTRAT